MGPLDEFYGEGTSEAFTEAVQQDGLDAKIEQVLEGEHVWVRVIWTAKKGYVGELKITCDRLNVHFAHLEFIDAQQRVGRYGALIATLPGLFKLNGVHSFTAAAADTDAGDVLRRGGFHDINTSTLGVTISEEDSRMAQYTLWKAGQIPEPAWHAAL